MQTEMLKREWEKTSTNVQYLFISNMDNVSHKSKLVVSDAFVFTLSTELK